jgi:hypothetical protein
MARNQVEAEGGGDLVQKSHENKEEERGTDSCKVFTLKLQEWHCFRIAFNGEIYNFDFGGVKLLAY